MAKRFEVSLKHARDVACLSHRLFETFQPVHRLRASAGKLLEASSYLHDIGHFVSGIGHHKHSAYLVYWIADMLSACAMSAALLRMAI